MRAIRAKEMEKQRKEDEERERGEAESMSRFNRSSSTQNNGHSLPPTSSLPPAKVRITF